MVLACLRVLKHHGVIALVSPFNYSNRYEFTPKATAVLAGRDSSLLQEGLAYCLKRSSMGDSQLSPSNTPTPLPSTILPDGIDLPESSHPTSFSLFGLTPSSSSYPPRTQQPLASSQQRPGRFVPVTGVSSFEPESSMGLDSRSHHELRWFKSALAELYCACSRSMAFGDLWLALTSSSDDEDDEDDDDTPRRPTSPWEVPNPPQLSPQPRRMFKGSIPDDHTEKRNTGVLPETRAISISSSLVIDTLSHHLESLKRRRHKRRSQSVSSSPREMASTSNYYGDWNQFLDRIDHRRFTSFGLLHGWIVRIHCYPCFPYPFPAAPTTSSSRTSSSFFPPAPTGVLGVTDDVPSSSSTMSEYGLARMAASLMDGTRCDDELACALETPFGKLVGLVEKYGRRSVIFAYAEQNYSSTGAW